MKKTAGVLMIIGAAIGLIDYTLANGAPQQCAAVVFPILTYIFARALITFSDNKREKGNLPK